MQQSKYTLRSKYEVVNLTTNNSGNIDNIIKQQLKRRYDELLQHCIYPLSIKYNITAELQDDYSDTSNNEEETIVVTFVAHMICEDAINCERLVDRIKQQLSKVTNTSNNDSSNTSYLQLISCKIS